jgi:hypothetical protein
LRIGNTNLAVSYKCPTWGPKLGWMKVAAKTSAGSPCRILLVRNEGRRTAVPNGQNQEECDELLRVGFEKFVNYLNPLIPFFQRGPVYTERANLP